MSKLTIRSLELHVNLGWPEKERSQEQVALLDIAIWFPEPPQACFSDNLHDTVCYSTLIQHIRTMLAKKKFNLIEHLSYAVYQIIKAHLPQSEKINVRITKYPAIDGLLNGVTFDYGDNPALW